MRLDNYFKPYHGMFYRLACV